MFPKLLSVQSLGKYKLFLKYEDEVKGVLDLSNLAHQGVFDEWEQNNLFDKVHIDSETGAIAWNEDIDICPDSSYLKILGLSFSDWKKRQLTYATD